MPKPETEGETEPRSARPAVTVGKTDTEIQ